MYDISIFREIKFPKGKLFEDTGTIYKAFLLSDSIACGYYCIRENSIVTRKFTQSKMDLIEMTDIMAENVLHVYPDLASAVLRKRVHARFCILKQMRGTDGFNKKRAEIVGFIKLHGRKVLADKKAPFRDKLSILLLWFDCRAYYCGQGLFWEMVKYRQ